MKRLRGKLEEYLDNSSIRRKLLILYIFCVLFPIIITDSVIVYIVFNTEKVTRQHEIENAASAVEYNLVNSIDNMARIAENAYTNRYIDDFMEKEYDSQLEYLADYQSLLKNTILERREDSTLITMYVDNESIINGGKFHKISTIKDSDWYCHMKENDQDQMLYIYYDKSRSVTPNNERKIIYVKRMNFFSTEKEKLVKLEMDYNRAVRDLVEMKYDMPIFLCHGDKITLSNRGQNSLTMDFEIFPEGKKVDYSKKINMFGKDLNLNVMKAEMVVFKEIINNLPTILLLVLINVVLPIILMKQINRSFTSRLWKLSEIFESVEDENLLKLETVRGTDEIGSLMHNYNKMAERTNELVQTVYKDKMREQEINIARQKAELLALHSQINPHFLFNALESIRMHCVLKGEDKTAKMVEKLALLHRQYVEWGNDWAKISEEIELVRAYLEVQRYRFGERLSYILEVEEECETMKIPKLTLVTFVENACIHGVESKTTPSWIFVRVYKEGDSLCLEIEDTGAGMEEGLLEELQYKMENASIELLKNSGNVGIINACLRLKIVSNNEVLFKIEGEEEVGTIVQIKIPLKYV